MHKQSLALTLCTLGILATSSTHAWREKLPYRAQYWISSQYRYFENVFMDAVRTNDPTTLTRKYEKRDYLFNTKLSNGEYPLIYALKHKAFRVAHALIAMDADVAVIDNYKKTPLHICTNFIIAQALIEKGARVDVLDFRQDTPLHSIKQEEGAVELIRLFMKYGAEVNARNKSMRTPLHQAANNKWGIEAVELLLQYKANPSARDQWGNKPINLARIDNVRQVLKIAMARKTICPPAFSSASPEKIENWRNKHIRLAYTDQTERLCERCCLFS